MSRLKDPKLIVGTIVAVALMVASRRALPVPLPHIQLPGEAIPGLPALPIPFIGDLYLTNTILAVLLTDVALLALALAATRRISMVPSGAQNLIEAVIEWWQNQSVQMIGEDLTRRWLPLVVTVFLLICVANWAELVPGYDTVGVLFQPNHQASSAVGAQTVAGSEAAGTAETESASGRSETLFAVQWTGTPGDSVGVAMRALPEDEAPSTGWQFVPFLRVAASDLSFTIALALICFVAIEWVGVSSGGLGYFKKFIDIDFSGGVFAGGLNIFVGVLELLSELARIISFSFRLFGNLFAGETLLFVFPFLVPFLFVLPVFGLELFVGLIQAFVFAILTLAFMSVAVVAHHGDGGH